MMTPTRTLAVDVTGRDTVRAVTKTVFHGGQVFDGTGAPLAGADVVMEAGRIVAVGPGLDGDAGVDCAGMIVLPGLIDCHVHLAVTDISAQRFQQTPFSSRFYEAIDNMAATLAAGETTVRDAAGADLGMKTAVEKGLVPGPRMQISITMLSQTGGHGDGWLPSGAQAEIFPEYPGAPGSIVDGPDECRRKVRELVRAGADVIKIATSGGVLSPRDKPQQPGFDVEGDSVVLAPKGPHKTEKVVVSAPPGTTLYYLCAIHPWMQGKIVVTMPSCFRKIALPAGLPDTLQSVP
jgi:imidazolonepropionase-like amidohydrolase